MQRICFVLVLALLFSANVQGKRPRPKPVTPVKGAEVTYSADGTGREAFVVATDTSSGKELWRVRIFKVHIKFWIEEDNQWIYITNLKLSGNTLLVRDERDRCYQLELNTKKVKKDVCSQSIESKPVTGGT